MRNKSRSNWRQKDKSDLKARMGLFFLVLLWEIHCSATNDIFWKVTSQVYKIFFKNKVFPFFHVSDLLADFKVAANHMLAIETELHPGLSGKKLINNGHEELMKFLQEAWETILVQI